MDYSALASSILVSSPKFKSPLFMSPLATSSPLQSAHQHQHQHKHQHSRILRLDSSFDFDSLDKSSSNINEKNSLEAIKEEGIQEISGSGGGGDRFGGGNHQHQRCEDRSSSNRLETLIPTHIVEVDRDSFSQGISLQSREIIQSELESILDGTIFENSSRKDEFVDRLLQITELRLKLADSVNEHRNPRPQRDNESGSANTRHRNSLVSCEEWARLTRQEVSALMVSLVTEIQDCCYDRSNGVDENMNLVPFKFQEDRQLDVRTQGEQDQGENEDAKEGLRQHLARWVEHSINRDDVIHKIRSASVVGSQLLAWNLAGWSAAYIIQRCGKVALTAVGGGLVLLKLASDHGYILVNWSSIYDQLEQAAAVTGDDKEGVLDDWITRKVKSFKTYAQNNSYIVVGFVCGFFYRTLG